MEVLPRYQDYIEKEQQAFKRVLETYLPKETHKPQRILNICCGVVPEEPVLFEHFGSNIELVSLDKDQRLEKIAKLLRRKTFRKGDITELGKHIEGKFDLVLGRNVPLNPNYRPWAKKLPDPWPSIFEVLSDYIEPTGILFLTVLREDEMYRAEQILGKRGYRIKVKEKNSIPVPSSYITVKGSDTKDHYVIIAQPSLQFRLSITPSADGAEF